MALRCIANFSNERRQKPALGLPTTFTMPKRRGETPKTVAAKGQHWSPSARTMRLWKQQAEARQQREEEARQQEARQREEEAEQVRQPEEQVRQLLAEQTRQLLLVPVPEQTRQRQERVKERDNLRKGLKNARILFSSWFPDEKNLQPRHFLGDDQSEERKALLQWQSKRTTTSRSRTSESLRVVVVGLAAKEKTMHHYL